MKSLNSRTVKTFLTGLATAWTLAGAPLPAAELIGDDLNDGRPMAAGRTVAIAPGRDYDLTGGGANFGALQKHDQGHFACAELEGGFQLTVRLLEFENVANYKNFTQGGLMVRKSLDPGSEFVALVGFATGESNGFGTGFYTRYEYEGIARERGVGGGWRVIGEAIYGTRFWTTQREGDVRFTAKGDYVYAIFLKWPGQKLSVKSVKPVSGSSLSMLGVPGNLEWTWDEAQGLTIHYPSQKPRPTSCSYAWAFKIKVK